MITKHRRPSVVVLAVEDGDGDDGDGDGDGESNLEGHLARHGNLRRSTETHPHTSEPQDDASLAIETLGVRVHRLALCGNLRENDDRRGRLLIVVHPDGGYEVAVSALEGRQEVQCRSAWDVRVRYG